MKICCTFWRGALVEVIAVHVHVEAAGRDREVDDAGEDFGQPLRQSDATALDANEDHVRAGLVALGNFVGDAGQGALDAEGVQNDGGFRHGGKRAACCVLRGQQFYS